VGGGEATWHRPQRDLAGLRVLRPGEDELGHAVQRPLAGHEPQAASHFILLTT
jgi:hypothetical protein